MARELSTNAGVRGKSLVVFASGLMLALCFFYSPWLINQESFYLSDITYYFEPLCRFIGIAFSHNKLPLWNPYSYCGMPQIAIPSPGLFYPINVLFGLLPFNQALAWSMVIHQWIAGLGSFLLIQSLSWGVVAACVAGLTLALSGYMFSLQSNYTLVATAAWLPACLWSFKQVDATTQNRNIFQIVLSSFTTAMLITAGRPEVSLPGFLLIAAQILILLTPFRSVDPGRQDRLKATFWRCFALFMGLLLSMPAVLPAWEWALLSPRSHGLQPTEVLRWSANWYDFLCLFLSQPLGDLNLLGAKYLPVVATRTNYIPYLSSAFVGPIAITLAIWGGLDKTWRGRWLLLIVLSISIVVALGKNTIIFPWLMTTFPALSILRYPVKLMVIPIWCVAMAGARGTHLSLTGKLTFCPQVVTCVFWAASLVVSCCLITTAQFGWILTAVHPRGASPVNLNVTRSAQMLIGQSGVCAALIGLSTCLIGYLLWRKVMRKNTFSILLISGLVFTLITSAMCFARHGTNQDFFDRSAFLQKELANEPIDGANVRLSEVRILPIYFDPLTCPARYSAESHASKTETFFQYGRQLLLPNTHMDFGLSSSWGYESAETDDYRKIFTTSLRQSQDQSGDLALAHFCQMTATAYVFTQVFKDGLHKRELPKLDSNLFKLKMENHIMNVRIYSVRDPMPRAYFAKTWKNIARHDLAMSEIINIKSSGFNPKEMTLIEPHVMYGSEPLPKSFASSHLPASSWVEFLQDKPEHVALSTKSAAPGLLVLSDHYYPGWTAKLDNMPVDIHCANAVFRSVFLPAGSHLLEFDYKPASLKTGLNLATFAFTICAILLTVVAMRKFWTMAKEQSRE